MHMYNRMYRVAQKKKGHYVRKLRDHKLKRTNQPAPFWAHFVVSTLICTSSLVVSRTLHTWRHLNQDKHASSLALKSSAIQGVSKTTH